MRWRRFLACHRYDCKKDYIVAMVRTMSGDKICFPNVSAAHAENIVLMAIAHVSARGEQRMELSSGRNRL